eukprot:scaffold702_cov350-Pinguiococcus_pyrenoidosus.AAC.5
MRATRRPERRPVPEADRACARTALVSSRESRRRARESPLRQTSPTPPPLWSLGAPLATTTPVCARLRELCAPLRSTRRPSAGQITHTRANSEVPTRGLAGKPPICSFHGLCYRCMGRGKRQHQVGQWTLRNAPGLQVEWQIENGSSR